MEHRSLYHLGLCSALKTKCSLSWKSFALQNLKTDLTSTEKQQQYCSFNLCWAEHLGQNHYKCSLSRTTFSDRRATTDRQHNREITVCDLWIYSTNVLQCRSPVVLLRPSHVGCLRCPSVWEPLWAATGTRACTPSVYISHGRLYTFKVIWFPPCCAQLQCWQGFWEMACGPVEPSPGQVDIPIMQNRN